VSRSGLLNMRRHILIAGLLPLRITAKSFGPLRFKENGTFHINVFEDLHFGNGKRWRIWTLSVI
jgi:hypothetical protein